MFTGHGVLMSLLKLIDDTILNDGMMASFVISLLRAAALYAVTFARYWKKLDEGLPKEKIVRVTKWPARDGKCAVLGKLEDRQNASRMLIKILEFVLQ
ncbi:hypothetical protein RCL_jg17616.t1 [Rhizophagus clarus]|uniref:Uncharacterized protein n=1 Tax=Rhizophagus clarus TaxID=94130 RepID=A0A8H3L3G0_9GLOM|nr:hypothetical protein RCL_jg17616.t1 [Rhizophagus clarus]